MNEVIRDPTKKITIGKKIRLRGTQKPRRLSIKTKRKRFR